MREAEIEETGAGLRRSAFKSPSAPSPKLGIGVHILQPGETRG